MFDTTVQPLPPSPVTYVLVLVEGGLGLKSDIANGGLFVVNGDAVGNVAEDIIGDGDDENMADVVDAVVVASDDECDIAEMGVCLLTTTVLLVKTVFGLVLFKKFEGILWLLDVAFLIPWLLLMLLLLLNIQLAMLYRSGWSSGASSLISVLILVSRKWLGSSSTKFITASHDCCSISLAIVRYCSINVNPAEGMITVNDKILLPKN